MMGPIASGHFMAYWSLPVSQSREPAFNRGIRVFIAGAMRTAVLPSSARQRYDVVLLVVRLALQVAGTRT